MISVGIVDYFLPLFACPDHTKFGPDRVVETMTRNFNAFGVFNLSMLPSCAEDCSSAQSYNGSILLH